MGVLVYMLALGMETAYAQIRLDDAIQRAAQHYAFRFERGASIAVVSMQASPGMSDYLIDRMINVFDNAGLTVVSRDDARLEQVRRELMFQTSREVDQATAQSIGRFMGVRFIATGAFEPHRNAYRFRVRVIEVATAIYVGGVFTANVRGDDFTTAQRWGIVGLNLVPGLGSFVVMNDTFGGVTQLLIGGAGLGFLAFGIMNTYREERYDPIFSRPETFERDNRWAIYVGGALLAVQNIYSIIRASTNTRPGIQSTRTASVINPEAWSFAIVPGRNGIEGVSLFYAMRF